MNFNLKKPCSNCPFRSDKNFPLRKERVIEIVDGIEDGRTFTCHKTLDCEEQSHCAGAIQYLDQKDLFTRPLSMARTLGLWDGKTTRLVPVYKSKEQMIMGCSMLVREVEK